MANLCYSSVLQRDCGHASQTRDFPSKGSDFPSPQFIGRACRLNPSVEAFGFHTDKGWILWLLYHLFKVLVAICIMYQEVSYAAWRIRVASRRLLFQPPNWTWCELAMRCGFPGLTSLREKVCGCLNMMIQGDLRLLVFPTGMNGIILAVDFPNSVARCLY
ncbi:hypothetical protein V6N12_041826 [Hibiscus sabdariffa]|uniref:Uncharacterized protein n=1 Tax=Hibiscus sabdariffa TaxID=183260 RepID=A0ABR2EDG3_9ROSI